MLDSITMQDLKNAVNSVPECAEKIKDSTKELFVDANLVPHFLTNGNQIIYGRNGPDVI
jgi:hypothetical protein